MEQKFLLVDSDYEIQTYLDMGWKIVSVTAQYVACSSTSYQSIKGKFAVVLERQNANK